MSSRSIWPGLRFARKGAAVSTACRRLILVTVVAFVAFGTPVNTVSATQISTVTFTGPGLGSSSESHSAAFIPVITYEMTFAHVAPIDMLVNLTGAGAIRITFDTFLVDTVFNATGVAWTDYHFELGTGSGNGFVRPFDGLAFVENPPPVSTAFTNHVQQQDSVVWSGGVVPAGGGVNFLLQVDVPDGLSQFTLRQFPSTTGVPQPGSVLLLGAGVMGLAGLAWRRHAEM
jgi:hypothetical protein